MQALRFLFSPSGRLGPQAFAVAVIVVYAAGAASQWLTVPGVVARNGLWPFALAQAVLIWVWFALHAKRLRDADRSAGLAAGASLLYALAVVLLLIVATAFFTTSPSAATGANPTGALGLILLLSIAEPAKVAAIESSRMSPSAPVGFGELRCRLVRRRDPDGAG